VQEHPNQNGLPEFLIDTKFTECNRPAKKKNILYWYLFILWTTKLSLSYFTRNRNHLSSKIQNLGQIQIS